MDCRFDINTKNARPISLCVKRSKGHTIYKHRLSRTLLWRHTVSLSEVRCPANPQDLLEETVITNFIVLMI